MITIEERKEIKEALIVETNPNGISAAREAFEGYSKLDIVSSYIEANTLISENHKKYGFVLTDLFLPEKCPKNDKSGQLCFVSNTMLKKFQALSEKFESHVKGSVYEKNIFKLLEMLKTGNKPLGLYIAQKCYSLDLPYLIICQGENKDNWARDICYLLCNSIQTKKVAADLEIQYDFNTFNIHFYNYTKYTNKEEKYTWVDAAKSVFKTFPVCKQKHSGELLSHLLS